MARQKGAFTLVELILIVLFVGILAFIVVPRMNLSAISKQKADTTARKIVTDLRRTRRLAISDAANNTAGFALKMTGSSPYTGYEIENLDTAETVDSYTIDSAITCTGGSEFNFGPLGNLLTGSDTQLSVSASGKTFTITITSATGMIKCTEN
jgi:Tfp pilus assembly protein FimT